MGSLGIMVVAGLVLAPLVLRAGAVPADEALRVVASVL